MAKKQTDQIEENKIVLSEEQLAEGRRILEEARKKRALRVSHADEIIARGKARSKGRKHMSLENQRSVAGFLFVLPWILGFALFFVYPIVQSAIFSFSSVKLGTTITWTSVGLANYQKIFGADVSSTYAWLMSSLNRLLYNVPIVTIFSLFVAIILNQKFRGRTFARAIFFVPVIIASGLIMGLIQSDIQTIRVERGSGASGSTAFQGGTQYLVDLLYAARIPQDWINIIRDIIANIFSTVWRSGIQILLFLGALQTIPTSFYEASAIEGATGWETFWKITFPIISPYISVTIVYTVIDSFNEYIRYNSIPWKVQELINGGDYGYAAAISWLYFLIIGAALGIVLFILNRVVFYMVD